MVNGMNHASMMMIASPTAESLRSALPVPPSPSAPSTTQLGVGNAQVRSAPSRQQASGQGGPPHPAPLQSSGLSLSAPITAFLTQSLGQEQAAIPASGKRAADSYSRAASLSGRSAAGLAVILPPPAGRSVDFLA